LPSLDAGIGRRRKCHGGSSGSDRCLIPVMRRILAAVRLLPARNTFDSLRVPHRTSTPGDSTTTATSIRPLYVSYCVFPISRSQIDKKMHGTAVSAPSVPASRSSADAHEFLDRVPVMVIGNSARTRCSAGSCSGGDSALQNSRISSAVAVWPPCSLIQAHYLLAVLGISTPIHLPSWILMDGERNSSISRGRRSRRLGSPFPSCRPDDIRRSLAVHGREVAGAHPARLVDRLAGLVPVVPIALHHR